MPVYIDYALKASLCLAIIFLFYRLLLKQITWYKWNRFFLLAFPVFSFIAPFINVNSFAETTQLKFVSLTNYVSAFTGEIPATEISNDPTSNYWALLAIVYISISLLLLIRLFVQVLSIRKIKSEAILSMNGGVEIYDVSKPVLPFSFLNGIYIYKNNYTHAELQEILDHERVHVLQRHSIDVLIAELICIVNWYNPFAWLLKKAVRENLEFIADDAVIQKGSDRKGYQYLLLKVTGIVPSAIANSFSFTSLKSRIRMMNKVKNGKLHLLKFILVVPLVTLLLLAFRQKQTVYTKVAINKSSISKTYVLSSLTYAVPDKKIEAEVQQDKENSLLKTGQPLDLDMIANEKTRLLNFLGKAGHTNIDPHAIVFMIDTTLGNNSFSIQVNINLRKGNFINGEELSANENVVTDKRINAAGDLITPADAAVSQPRLLKVQNNHP